MQKKSPLNSASITPRGLFALLVCAAACVMATRTSPAFLRSEAPPTVSQHTLTFAERVAYQRAIEDVYWRHRIWPKERPDPKPSLDAVMSQAQLERKVADYLRKSQALEDYWQRPITAEQLQAEMDRMAIHTRQAEVLRELFAALGNDPFVIAECLARPALADRLLTSWYGYDQGIHAAVRQRDEAELLMHPMVDQIKQLSGKYTETEFVRSDGGKTVGQARRLPNEQLAGAAPALQQQGVPHSIKLNRREWDETVQRLVLTPPAQPTRLPPQKPTQSGPMSPSKDASITQIKTGVISSLQEDESRYYVTAVIEKTENRLKLAAVSWFKEPLESWMLGTENHPPIAMTAPGGKYALPKISEGGCIDDTWTATAGPPDARSSHTAIWTGSEMIVWGGLRSATSTYLDDGARYSPSTDTWTPTSGIDTPTARAYHTAVWTGSEMIVWGGYSQEGGGVLNSGGRYDPSTDSWTTTSTTNVPTGRESDTAIWTGSEMIVWGGYDISGFQVNTGGRYNAGTNSWTATSTNNAPSARVNQTAVWTGSEMIIWGGYDGITRVNTGARYDPETDSWTETSTSSAPTGRDNHSAVWTGSEMIAWGGIDDSDNNPNTGGRYDPVMNSWVATSTVNAPDGR